MVTATSTTSSSRSTRATAERRPPASSPATSAPPTLQNFTITNIRFKKDDNVLFQASGPANACAGPPKASIDYFVAVDCKVCAAGSARPNPNPSWTRVPLPATNPAEVTFNVLDLGFTGSQLCWQARLSSPNQYCQPTINSVSVGYQAVRSGLYSRSSLSTVGNAFVYGTYETPGQSWTGPWPTAEPAGSIRNYDGKPDLSIRGHLYLKSIYDPEKPDVSQPGAALGLGRQAGHRLPQRRPQQAGGSSRSTPPRRLPR